MTPTEPKFWFSAKAHGWGWGPLLTWQGWLVVASYCILVLLALLLLDKPKAVPLSILLTLILMLVCWLKGEPPRWR